jgi:hypothetical protein
VQRTGLIRLSIKGVILSKKQKVSGRTRRFGNDVPGVSFDERIFIYDKKGTRIGFIAVKRTLEHAVITSYAVNLVSLPERHFCGTEDMRLLGFDTKWHNGKTGDCHRHCVCRGKVVVAMEGEDCAFCKIVDTFFSEVQRIGDDMDWDMEELEKIPA